MVSKPKRERKKSAVSVDSEAVRRESSRKKSVEAPVRNGHHENTSKWVISKFEAPKKLDEIGKEEHKDVVYHHENKKKTEKREESESESESEQPAKKTKKDKKGKKAKKASSS